MTKYFCDSCGKEIPHSFLGKDIYFNIDSLNAEMILMIAEHKELKMLCEQCVMETLAGFFIKKADKEYFCLDCRKKLWSTKYAIEGWVRTEYLGGPIIGHVCNECHEKRNK